MQELILHFSGCLEVPDVHQVQQGLQDVPRNPDCVWREVRQGSSCEQGPRAPEPRGSLRARGPGCWALNVCPKHGGHRSCHQHLPSPLAWQMGVRGSLRLGHIITLFLSYLFFIVVKFTYHKIYHLTTLEVQFRSIWYIHNAVSPSPLSNSRTFS